mmetsp:Transcript_2598/g.3419  ORF Transcript_2598/g.3419 Transcript_2598/m.3419 type:complete len:201 (+) Transcript_2598:212-814(+)
MIFKVKKKLTLMKRLMRFWLLSLWTVSLARATNQLRSLQGSLQGNPLEIPLEIPLESLQGSLPESPLESLLESPHENLQRNPLESTLESPLISQQGDINHLQNTLPNRTEREVHLQRVTNRTERAVLPQKAINRTERVALPQKATNHMERVALPRKATNRTEKERARKVPKGAKHRIHDSTVMIWTHILITMQRKTTHMK